MGARRKCESWWRRLPAHLNTRQSLVPVNNPFCVSKGLVAQGLPAITIRRPREMNRRHRSARGEGVAGRKKDRDETRETGMRRVIRRHPRRGDELPREFFLARCVTRLARRRLRETDGRAVSRPLENLRVYSRVPGPLLDYIQHLCSDRHNSIPRPGQDAPDRPRVIRKRAGSAEREPITLASRTHPRAHTRARAHAHTHRRCARGRVEDRCFLRAANFGTGSISQPRPRAPRSHGSVWGRWVEWNPRN